MTVEESNIALALKQILLENDHLSIYLNNISYGEISTRSGYVGRGMYSFSEAPGLLEEDYRDRTGLISNTSIRIASFNLSAFKSNAFINTITELGNETTKIKTIYNKAFHDSKTCLKMGLNIFRDIKIKGYAINYIEIKKIFSEEYIGRSYRLVNQCFHEFYYIGEKNVLIGFTTTDNVLYLRSDILVKIANDFEVLKKILTNALNCYYLIETRINKLNIKNVENNLVEVITPAVINQITSNHLPKKGLNNELDIKRVEKLVEDYTIHEVQRVTANTIFGIRDSYSYTNALDTIIAKQKQSEGTIFQKGFASGMKMGLKLELIGWRFVQKPTFANSRSTDLWWGKEVKIIPSYFLYKYEKYEIPASHRKFQVNMLYVNQEGKLRCDGNHPNVSHGNVCMGDLVIHFGSSTHDLSEELSRAESLLEHVNYDSAYDRTYIEELLKVSKRLELFTTQQPQQPKSTSTIKCLNFVEDDEDEELVVAPPATPAQIVNTTPIADGVSVISEIGRPIDMVTEVSPQIFDNNVPVHYTPLINETDINRVSNNGVLTPLVFIANQEIVNNVATHVIQEDIQLGDFSLL